MTYGKIYLIVIMALLLQSCQKTTTDQQNSAIKSSMFFLQFSPDKINLAFATDTLSYNPVPNLDEASGIVCSFVNQGSVWVEEDSGNGPFLYRYSDHGKLLTKCRLLNYEARDAEDMGYGPTPSGSKYNQLYVADIGDNKRRRSIVDIYTFKEPVIPDSVASFEIPVDKKIRLKYPGKSENAEAFFVDPLTNKMYIFSKESSISNVYTLSFPYSYDKTNLLSLVGNINIRFQKITAADISRDGMKILIKTLDYIFYWERNPGEDLNETFTRLPLKVPYVPEAQGEAVCWNLQDNGYFTFSELSDQVIPKLYSYKIIGVSQQN